jgi:superfamily II DNA or RNA helicase
MLTNYIQKKGYSYEKYILDLSKNDYDDIWFFKDVPEYIIAKTSLYDSYELYTKYRNCDIGADLVAIKDDQIYFIQCKNYDNIISINDLASFYFLLYEFKLNGIVYYNGKLSERLTDLSKNKVKYINIPFNNEIIKNAIFNPYIDNLILSPKEYQLEAVKLLQDKHRSILSFPCGMGKTFTSYLIAKSYNNIILISPTRTLAEELLYNMDTYLLKFGTNESLEKQYNPILISMDGSIDPLYIKSIIKEKNIISVTYNSVDILNKIIDILENPYIIVDEYHNLSQSNLIDPENEFNKILNSKYPILFLSATPIENTNNNIFGDTIFKYSWSLAISNHYICDLKIILPEYKNYNDIFEQLLNNIEYNKTDIKLVKKAYFLLRSLLYEGSRKCIVYLTCIEQSNKFYNIIIWSFATLQPFLKTIKIKDFYGF